MSIPLNIVAPWLEASLPEAAEWSNINIREIKAAIKAGEIPIIPVGPKLTGVKVHISDLWEWSLTRRRGADE
jgi:hypothetical protein